MRVTACLLLLYSINALALPVTYQFEGSVTAFQFQRQGTALALDPTAPLIRPDGSVVFNGDTQVSGLFTIDFDSIPTPYQCADLPLSYSMSTEGANYSRSASQGCTDAVTSTPTQLTWHLEGPSLNNSGGLESSIQNFVFNFDDGLFKDGNFELKYMFDSSLGIFGSVHGVISSLEQRSAVSVTEPQLLYLLIPGMLLLLRRRAAAA